MPLTRYGTAPDPYPPAINRHEIDTRRPRPTVATLQLRRGNEQTLLLPPRQPMRRTEPPTRPPPLDLDHHQQTPPPAHQIHLPARHPHVAPHDQIAADEIQQRGEPLAVPPHPRRRATQPERSAQRSAGERDTDRVA